MNTLLIKVILMPLVIAGVTFISRRWGNSLGGLIASLPWVAGPIIIFLILERGSTFAINTIPGIMMGIIGWVVFCFSYLWLGQKFNPFITLFASYIAYILPSIFLSKFTNVLGLNTWFSVTMLIIFGGFIWFPKIRSSAEKTKKTLKYDVIFRMITITIFVVAITYFAEILGPTWSGILTPFPIMTSVLAVFTHYTQGIYATRVILVGLFTGIIGFTIFLFSLAYLLPIMSIPMAFTIGVSADLLITLIVKYLLDYIQKSKLVV